jgi:hypothetical protein
LSNPQLFLRLKGVCIPKLTSAAINVVLKYNPAGWLGHGFDFVKNSVHVDRVTLEKILL